MMISCNEINDYIQSVKKGETIVCENVRKLCEHVEKCFANEKLKVDRTQLDYYLRIGELMFKEVYQWEKFLLALLLCTYTQNNRPRWNRALIEIVRGAGKDGFIAWLSLCMISPRNPVQHYDVDICANNEDQATRPVKDVIEFLERPDRIAKNKTAFHWTIENVDGLANKGRIKGHTNSPKGKDGLRSGCVILNEIHQYTDYANVNVFTTGLGKKEHPRLFMFTTNGDVREGVLDQYLEEAEPILNGDVADNGWLYYLCSLDSKEEVHNEKNWYKANPSLAYNQSLLEETRLEYNQWKNNPQTLPAFMTKRMNMPVSASDKVVVDYEYIKATNKPLPNLEHKQCVVGVDLSRTTDMCSVSLIFKEGKTRYVINHSWICTHSNDWGKIKVKDQFPIWVEKGLLTIVDDIEINPSLVVDYIQQAKQKYVITKVAIDDFRQSIFSYDLAKIGITRENKNLKLVRPSDIAKVVPIIESAFINEQLVWGDNPILRWCCNNTKVIPWKPQSTGDNDMGNQIYAKIEPRSRKTDAFMSFVAGMTCENDLVQQVSVNMDLLRVYRG